MMHKKLQEENLKGIFEEVLEYTKRLITIGQTTIEYVEKER